MFTRTVQSGGGGTKLSICEVRIEHRETNDLTLYQTITVDGQVKVSNSFSGTTYGCIFDNTEDLGNGVSIRVYSTQITRFFFCDITVGSDTVTQLIYVNTNKTTDYPYDVTFENFI